jgi:hypothetical protein
MHRRRFLSGGFQALCGWPAASCLMSLVGGLVSPGSRADASEAVAVPQARDIARGLIPFDQLTPRTQDRIWGVVDRPTIHRRLPTQAIGCDPDLYLFLLRNPEVVVNMWQLMGITSLSVRRVAPYTYDAKDGAGTQAKVELVYGTPDTHIFFADGAYEGPLLKRRTPGRCIMVLKTEYARDPRERVRVTNQMDAFLQLDQAGLDVVARTLQPLIGKTADHNFSETLLFVSRVSESVEKNASGVQRLVSRLEAVDADVRDQFVTVAQTANQRAATRRVDP